MTYRVDDAHSGYIADVRYEGEAQPYQHPPGYVPFTVHTVQPKSGKMNPSRSRGSNRQGHWSPTIFWINENKCVFTNAHSRFASVVL